MLGLSENRFLCQNVDLRRIAIAELGLENIEDIALDLDDALGGGDLAAQCSLLDRGGDDVGRQRQIRCLELELLLLGLGVEALDAADVRTPDVRYE